MMKHTETEHALTQRSALTASIGSRSYNSNLLDVHLRCWSANGDITLWLDRDESLSLLDYLRRYERALLHAESSAEDDQNEPIKRNPKDERVLQIIPALPGWYAVFADGVEPEEGKDAFSLEPLVGWALVDHGSGQDLVGLCVWTAEQESMPDASPWMVGGKMNGFLGYQFPGCITNWRELAFHHQLQNWDAAKGEWRA
jgi:hypothetical protein